MREGSLTNERGRVQALPARTINPFPSLPPTYQADRTTAVLERACQGDYVPVWQVQSLWHTVRCDANRTPGMNALNLATAKSILRHEKGRGRFAYQRVIFNPVDKTWGWRAAIYAHLSLAVLRRFETIGYEGRMPLLKTWRRHLDGWDTAARVHAYAYGVTLPAREDCNAPPIPGVIAYRTEFSRVPPGMSEKEWRGWS